MSPIPATASSQPTPYEYTFASANPMNAPPSLSHLTIVGTFFLAMLFVFATGIFGYCIFKCITWEKKPKPSSFRPLILSRLISPNGTICFIKQAKPSDHPCRGIPAYTVNGNGVKKGVRLYSSAKSKLDSQKPKSTDPADISFVSRSSTIADFAGTLQLSNSSLIDPTPSTPLTVPAPAKRMHAQNEVDLYMNPKLYPVQGPIKRMDVHRPDSPEKRVEITPPPAAHFSPLSKSRSSLATYSLCPREAADMHPNMEISTRAARSPVSKALTLPSASPASPNVANVRTTFKLFSPTSPEYVDVVCNTSLVHHSVLQTSNDLRSKPRAFSVYTQATQAGTPANALTALSLASSKRRPLAELTKNHMVPPVPGHTKTLHSLPHQSLRYGTVTAARKTHVIHRGKENLLIARSAPYF